MTFPKDEFFSIGKSVSYGILNCSSVTKLSEEKSMEALKTKMETLKNKVVFFLKNDIDMLWKLIQCTIFDSFFKKYNPFIFIRNIIKFLNLLLILRNVLQIDDR